MVTEAEWLSSWTLSSRATFVTGIWWRNVIGSNFLIMVILNVDAFCGSRCGGRFAADMNTLPGCERAGHSNDQIALHRARSRSCSF